MLTQADIDQWADEGWDLSRLEHREVLMDRLLVMGRQADVELVDHHADLIRLAYALPRYGGVLARIVQELRPWSWARPEQRAALLEGLTEIGHVAVEDEGRRRMRLWLDGRLVSFDGTRNQRLVALEDRQRRSPLLGDPNQRKLFQDGRRDLDVLVCRLKALPVVLDTRRWCPRRRRRTRDQDRLYLTLDWDGWRGTPQERNGPRRAVYVDLLRGELTFEGSYDALERRASVFAVRAVVSAWWEGA